MNEIARDKMQHLGYIFFNISTLGIIIFTISLLSQFFQMIAFVLVLALAFVIVFGTLGLSLLNEGVRTFLAKCFDFSTNGWWNELSLKLLDALPYITVVLGVLITLSIVFLSFNAKNDTWKLIKICLIGVLFLVATILGWALIFGGAN